jgi:hypothetical protein
MILLGTPQYPQIEIPLDQLDAPHRLLYLQDFFPPNPAVKKQQALPPPSYSCQRFTSSAETPQQTSGEESEEKIEIVGV